MARETKHIQIQQKLKRSVIRIVAREGIENLTTKKISRASGFAEVYIYRYFKSKDDLLVQSFLDIDCQILEVISDGCKQVRLESADLQNMEEAIRGVWYLYWKYLMRHPEKTLYYFRFYLSANYTVEVVELRHRIYNTLMSIFKNKLENTEFFDAASFWRVIDHVAESTMMAAVRVIRDNMLRRKVKLNEYDVERIYRLTVLPAVQMLQASDPKAGKCNEREGI